MGYLLVFGSWFVQQWVALWSAFSSPRFDAVRSVRDDVLCDVGEQNVGHVVKFMVGGPGGLREQGRPLAKRVGGFLEADSQRRRVVLGGGLEHECADEVVGDEVHAQFLANHLWGFAFQDVHAHGGFHIAQKQFGQPAFAIEVGEGAFGGRLWCRSTW